MATIQVTAKDSLYADDCDTYSYFGRAIFGETYFGVGKLPITGLGFVSEDSVSFIETAKTQVASLVNDSLALGESQHITVKFTVGESLSCLDNISTQIAVVSSDVLSIADAPITVLNFTLNDTISLLEETNTKLEITVLESLLLGDTFTTILSVTSHDTVTLEEYTRALEEVYFSIVSTIIGKDETYSLDSGFSSRG